MKTKVSLVFLIIAAVFLYFVFKGGYFKPGQTAPPETTVRASGAFYIEKILGFDLRDYHGEKLNIDKAGLKNNDARLVIHLWASWCGPCVNEVPELIEYAKKNPDVKFIIASMDDYQEDIEKFLKSFPEFDSSRFIRVWDRDKHFTKLFDADRLPMTILISPNKSEPQLVKSVVDWKRLRF